jgi:hypothetical protein
MSNSNLIRVHFIPTGFLRVVHRLEWNPEEWGNFSTVRSFIKSHHIFQIFPVMKGLTLITITQTGTGEISNQISKIDTKNTRKFINKNPLDNFIKGLCK